MDLSDLIDRNAAFAPDKPAINFGGNTLTYSAFARRIAAAARALKSQLGVTRGDRVAILSLNHPDYLVLLYACARLGAMLVPLNWRLAVPEQVFILQDASVKVLVVEKGFDAVIAPLKQALPDIRIIGLDFAPSFDDLLAAGDGDGRNPHVDLSAPLLIVYTSGTTGRPKGAVLRQEALLWNAVMSQHMHDMTAADHILTVLPLFHVGGLNIQTTPALQIGATVTLHARFAPDATLNAITASTADAHRAGARHHAGRDRASVLGRDRHHLPARAHHRLDASAAGPRRCLHGARRAGAAGLRLDRDLSGRGLHARGRRSARGLDRPARPRVRGARWWTTAGNEVRAGHCGRGRGARAAGLFRILGQCGRDRRNAARRLVSFGRHRHARRATGTSSSTTARRT